MWPDSTVRARIDFPLLRSRIVLCWEGVLGRHWFSHGLLLLLKKKKKNSKDLSALEVGKIRIHVHCRQTLKIFSSHFDCLINILYRILFAHKVFVLQKSILVIKTRICIL